MNDVIKVLTTRRSCKSFTSERVSDEIIDEITLCGTYAPTGKGQQSPIIVVVNDDETVSKLSKLNAKILGADIDPFYGAKTVLVVFADSTMMTYVEDGSLVMGNMLNAAHALGVGACWIHRAREMFLDEEGKALMKKWGIDEKYVGIGNCVIGCPTGVWKPEKPRKPDYVIKV